MHAGAPGHGSGRVSPEALALPGGARVLFTGRAEGNLSSVGGDGAHAGEEARGRLRASIGASALVRGHQVHGNGVARVRRDTGGGLPGDPSAPADGQATAEHGLAVMVLTADCMPIALAGGGAVAIVHAGWRGLAGGVLEEGVRALGELGGEAGESVAVMGPCAGACCYEVGEEVHAAFAGAHRRGSHIDLRAIARERLLAAGVGEVRDVAACTICDERWFSHRREGERAGRQAGVAWLA
jgi:polyphenol oxidase